MLAKHGKPSSSSLRVFCLLSTLTVVIANNAGELAKNASTTAVDDETNVPRTSGSEARTKGETLLGVEPSTRSAEWSNRGPFVRGKDSYLEALRHSRTSTDPREGVVDAVDDGAGSGSFQRRKEQSFAAKRSELSLQTSSDSYSMVPSDSYSLPTRPYTDFSGLRNSYGTPHQTQPPRGTYGPPHNDYAPYGGEHASVGVYPQPQPQPQPVPHVAYGAPHGITESMHLGFPSIDFSWPFALKLNAFTLAKILLKLVLFKMIVKFIAVICLLLFIPKLEIKKTIKKVNVQNNAQDDDDDDEDEGRILSRNWKIWDGLNLLTLAVNEALRQHEATNGSRSSKCSTLECQVRRAFENDQSWPDYEQLLQNYIMEETRRLRIKS
ncbi:hypothetical protein WN51_11328 [Melipona quadrifasciata]|uniref:Uncharacterized protein n=1 Tax=Melipona quadrifasciata TaxID=166423 RepID=A0A0N0BJW8_9HYME|nr:hypothetical protein WN51_11328 [Melipona quadrifasciata]